MSLRGEHIRAWRTWMSILAVAAVSARTAGAADHLIGHRTSVTSYGGNPVVGRLYKFIGPKPARTATRSPLHCHSIPVRMAAT